MQDAGIILDRMQPTRDDTGVPGSQGSFPQVFSFKAGHEDWGVLMLSTCLLLALTLTKTVLGGRGNPSSSWAMGLTKPWVKCSAQPCGQTFGWGLWSFAGCFHTTAPAHRQTWSPLLLGEPLERQEGKPRACYGCGHKLLLELMGLSPVEESGAHQYSLEPSCALRVFQ